MKMDMVTYANAPDDQLLARLMQRNMAMAEAAIGAVATAVAEVLHDEMVPILTRDLQSTIRVEPGEVGAREVTALVKIGGMNGKVTGKPVDYASDVEHDEGDFAGGGHATRGGRGFMFIERGINVVAPVATSIAAKAVRGGNG